MKGMYHYAWFFFFKCWLHVAQAGLEQLNLLPVPFWVLRLHECATRPGFYFHSLILMLGIKPRVFFAHAKHRIYYWVTPSAPSVQWINNHLFRIKHQLLAVKWRKKDIAHLQSRQPGQCSQLVGQDWPVVILCTFNKGTSYLSWKPFMHNYSS